MGSTPLARNHAWVLLEQHIRAGQAVAQGRPVAEGVAHVADEKADEALTEALPWIAEVTEPRPCTSLGDLRAVTKLYLLDNPVLGRPEKAELASLVGCRLQELTAVLTAGAVPGPAVVRQRTPAIPLSASNSPPAAPMNVPGGRPRDADGRQNTTSVGPASYA
jgi:hypothetical protein